MAFTVFTPSLNSRLLGNFHVHTRVNRGVGCMPEVKSCECRLRVQTKGGDLRKGGASDARYAIVLDRPEARGEAAAAIAAASDIFRDRESFKVA